MVGDVLLFPGRKRRIQHRVDREVSLPPAQPRCGVVQPHDDGEREGCAMDAELQLLTRAALEDLEVHCHTAERCKRCSELSARRGAAAQHASGFCGDEIVRITTSMAVKAT